MKLAGMGVVITGASQGLGRAIAEACLQEGAHLLLCARDAAMIAETHARLASKSAPDQVVLAGSIDVSSPDAMTALLHRATTELPNFNGLVNNAGILGPSGLTEDLEWTQWTQVLEINLLGTVLACRGALPPFRKQAYGKIVNVSGGGATSPLPRLSAYAVSKAAVVRFTENLAEECKGSGIDVNAISPGVLNTRMLDQTLSAEPAAIGAAYHERMLKQKQALDREGTAPLQRAADLCVYLLSPESDGITGKLISAVWDPWENLSSRKTELAGTDIYTLRRIVPEDRGAKW